VLIVLVLVGQTSQKLTACLIDEDKGGFKAISCWYVPLRLKVRKIQRLKSATGILISAETTGAAELEPDSPTPSPNSAAWVVYQPTTEGVAAG